ncbi:MAG: phenylalanine 4-monooxygenase [Ilumatobacteraceae bacterium]
MSVDEFIRTTGSALRGNYANARADFTVDQDLSTYTAEDQKLWRRLYERQFDLVRDYACEEYLEHLSELDMSQSIPDFAALSTRLRLATGWEIVAVPGLIPDLAFFSLLAARRFPTTVWLRKPEEFDYIVEPDIFHDCFGHVPLLFSQHYADYLQAYGVGALKAAKLGPEALVMIGRLFWFTVEFGLIRQGNGMRVFGAGIMSSSGEIVYSIDSPVPKRLPFDLERIMRTDYHIDRYQDPYFVIESFERLVADTAHDFTPVYTRLREMPTIAKAP